MRQLVLQPALIKVEQIERIVRITLDFAEEHVAAHDLEIKTSHAEIRDFAEWICENDPRSYREWQRARERLLDSEREVG